MFDIFRVTLRNISPLISPRNLLRSSKFTCFSSMRDKCKTVIDSKYSDKVMLSCTLRLNTQGFVNNQHYKKTCIHRNEYSFSFLLICVALPWTSASDPFPIRPPRIWSKWVIITVKFFVTTVSDACTWGNHRELCRFVGLSTFSSRESAISLNSRKPLVSNGTACMCLSTHLDCLS